MPSKRSFILPIAAAIMFFSFIIKEDPQAVKDFLSVPGPLEFNKTAYSLSWSSHPSDNYYKQEYLPANEKSETFTKMVMIEALAGTVSPKDAMMAKANELNERKKTDPVTNYQFIENKATGEYILDFVISSNDIVEWNVYRYMNLKDGPKKGLVLFAYSRRAYGAASTNFLKALKTERQTDINNLATYKMPAIKIKP